MFGHEKLGCCPESCNAMGKWWRHFSVCSVPMRTAYTLWKLL